MDKPLDALTFKFSHLKYVHLRGCVEGLGRQIYRKKLCQLLSAVFSRLFIILNLKSLRAHDD